MCQPPRNERQPTPAARPDRAPRDRIGTGRGFSRGPAVALAVLAALAAGCLSGLRRDCPPPCPELRAVSCGSIPYPATDPGVQEALAARLRGADGDEDGLPPAGRTFQILALSGGGRYGAFSAGVLSGWTAAGTRPAFDVVTGVSTGALVGVYAFLGPAYDDRMRESYTTVRTRDVFRRRALAAVPLAGSFATSAPLRRRIEDEVDDRVLADVAAAHAAGRRLYVGTTNLDTKRLVVWDMGALAACGKADLFRDVLLATASVPGQFPPVPIEVTVNGKTYTELHVDGGVTSEVFVRLSLLDVPPDQLRLPKPLAGSNVHVIVAGKLYADPDCDRPTLLGVLGKSVSSLVYAITQNELVRIYTLSLLTGMGYRFAALRADYPDEGGTLDFNPDDLLRLFNEGFRAGRTGDAWRSDPPGFRPAEQVIPRTGTDFVIPPDGGGGPTIVP